MFRKIKEAEMRNKQIKPYLEANVWDGEDRAGAKGNCWLPKSQVTIEDTAAIVPDPIDVKYF